MKKIPLVLLYLSITACSHLPTSSPFPAKQLSPDILEWSQTGTLTQCDANEIADFAITLAKNGGWTSTYTIRNYSIREHHHSLNEVTVQFHRGSEDSLNLTLTPQKIPSAKYKTVTDEGIWLEGQFSELKNASVTLHHHCQDHHSGSK